MNAQEQQVQWVRQAVEDILGSADGADYPRGWPGDIEAALVDSVFSARAVYETKRGRGVLPLVVAWRNGRQRSAWDLGALESEIAALGPEAWAQRFGSGQWSPSRPETALGGPTKAAAVLEAARNLLAVGISEADDITDDTAAKTKRAMRSVPGIGYATTNYFLMLLGRPGVKPDRMVHRFLKNATGSSFSDAAADGLVAAVAAGLNVDAHLLDHAIWKHESNLAAGRSRLAATMGDEQGGTGE